MATLVYSDVDGVDRSFALGSEPVTVGRGAECAIRSDDPRVSRVHARFYVDQGALWVEDLGSSNGIFVGPNKVSRAPVPTGEIILVGSLLIRLLPANGTLPPPVGLHGTLATWLDMERKTRAAVEEERDAFARRVGEMHQQLSAVMSARTMDPEAPDLVRQRDEASARAVAFERTLAQVQQELIEARDRLAELGTEVAERVDWSLGDTAETG
ncbi:MAG TPA: FHA domain-containing protein, partial [Kofleriaceae bacterium]|nr:FHA domain-containing protein [Kofleriaceae bacterium]